MSALVVGVSWDPREEERGRAHAPLSIVSDALKRTSSVAGLIARPHQGKSAACRRQLDPRREGMRRAERTFTVLERRDDLAVLERDVKIGQALLRRDVAAVLGNTCCRCVRQLLSRSQ